MIVCCISSLVELGSNKKRMLRLSSGSCSMGDRADERMGKGGVAAIRATELTEEALLAGLRSRRVYATSGPRIWLATSLAGLPMGSTADAEELGDAPFFFVEVGGTGTVRDAEGMI